MPIEKGTYRVRITTREITHSSFENGQTLEVPIDEYIIEMWKSNFVKPKVLKALVK